jgi:curved DNA-binding protein CbpA
MTRAAKKPAARPLYDTLGVSAAASSDEIKHAFRSKAKSAHPDKGGDAAAFRAITHAYAVLGSPDRRARYDAHGDDADNPDNAFAAAFSLVQQAIDSIIDQMLAKDDDPCQLDVMAILKANFDKNASDIANEIARIEARLAMLTKIAKRFRVKRGRPNFMRRSTESKMQAARADIATGKDALKNMLAGRALLDDYEFEFDAPPPTLHPMTQFSFVVRRA